MKNTLIRNYNKALKDIYEHIGFKEDWSVFPINDSTMYYWKVEGSEVTFYDTLKAYKDKDEMRTYSNEIIAHSFYPESIYRGELYTGILVDTHTDGNKFLQIFLNEREIKI